MKHIQISLAMALTLFLAASQPAAGVPFNSLFKPADYPVLTNNFIASSGAVVINTMDGTNAPTWTYGANPPLYGQIVTNQSGSNVLALFSFGNLALSNAVTCTVTGNLGLVCCSTGNITLANTLNLSGTAGSAGGLGGPGAEGGLNNTSYQSAPPGSSRGNGGKGQTPSINSGNGYGFGGGAMRGPSGSGTDGSGGGYGGVGGWAWWSTTTTAGGTNYGDSVLTCLFGGSGGGGADNGVDTGGGGGGALELIANGTLSLPSTAVLQVNGGAGFNTGSRAPGGGSGGGMILAANNLILAGSLQANGGNGYNGTAKGGGGGGGRIALYANALSTNGLAVAISGGQSGDAAYIDATNGASGSFRYAGDGITTDPLGGNLTYPFGGSSLPRVANGVAQNVTATSADLTGTLTLNGSAATTVYLFCATNDCATNAANWATTGTVTTIGPFTSGVVFTNTITGLTPNTVYFWNLMASNSAGKAWGVLAGSPSFKTMGPPGVNNNGGATSIGPYSATLCGLLTNGGSAFATIYCGMNTNNWTYTNVIGTVTESQGVFSTNQTGLARSTTYYYSVLVSNQYGTAQSPATNFTTLPYVLINASTTLSASQTNLENGLSVVVDGTAGGVVLTLSNSATYGNLAVYQFGSLLVTNGASVVCLGQTASPYTVTNAGVAIQVSGDAIIGPGSSINADGQGFPIADGPGGSASGSGGTYGGRSPANPLPTYGSVSNPVCLGSGGANAAGGGAIKLLVAGNLIVNGRLSANGSYGGYGSGAGGSIWIAGSGTLGGTGEVQVSGGSGNVYYPNESGGGGRLAIDGTINYAFQGNIRGANGTYGAPYGDPGTVFFGAPLCQNFTVYSNQTIVMGNDIVNVFSNLSVYGTLIPGGSYEGSGTGCVIQATNITIASSGVIMADGWGFCGYWGPAPGNGSGRGGNHGGRGASNTNTLYGSVTQPVNMGSGSGANGGGAIKLIVSGNLLVNGTLRANGSSAVSGSGAGGSIWVTGGGTLNGTGSIQAYSPIGYYYGDGGGGRISIDDTMSYAFQGSILAGTTIYDSAPGTVYLPASARSNFLIDTNQTFIIGNGTAYSFGNLTVKGTLDCGGDPYTAPGGTGIVITANNLTIWSNGVIKADSRGFYGSDATSAWAIGPGMGGATTGATHAGIGYGNTNAVYGSATQPTTLGSGGYSSWNLWISSLRFGGGAVKLVVAGTLTINGTLSANGGGQANAGCGAGGSVWVDAGTLAGYGRIQANGGIGSGSTNYYGGGGGRIAIKYRTKGFAGLPAAGLYANADTNVSATVTVQGGYNVGTAGTEDGTIYISTVQQGTTVFFR